MLIASVLIYAACIALFIAAWRINVGVRVIAAPLLVFGVSEMRATWPATITSQLNDEVGIGPAVVTGIAFIACMLAFIITLHVSGAGRVEAARFRDAPFRDRRPDAAHLLALMALALGLIILGTVLYRGLPPVVHAARSLISLTDSQESLTQLTVERRDLTKGHIFGGSWRGQGLIATVMQVGWGYLVMSAAALYVKKRDPRRALLVALFLFLGMVYVGGAGERFPIVIILVAALMAITIMVRVTPRHLVVGMWTLAAFVFVIAPIGGGYSELGSASENVSRTATRIFLGNGKNNIRIVQYIGEGRLSFAGGNIHLEKLLSALPGLNPDVPFSNRLQQLRADATSETGYSSSTYFGMLYADFGPAGVLVGYSLIGVGAAVASNRLFRRRKEVLNVALNGSVITSFFYLSVGSSIAVLTYMGILLAIHSGVRAIVALLSTRVQLGGDVRRRPVLPFTSRLPQFGAAVHSGNGR